MCFCECDIVNVKIHLRSKRLYPGIKYDHESLSTVAEEYGFKWSTEVDALPEAAIPPMAARLLELLPDSACPEGLRASAA
jgi:hypothetical protein